MSGSSSGTNTVKNNISSKSSASKPSGNEKNVETKKEEPEPQVSQYQKTANEMQARSARGRVSTGSSTTNTNNDALVHQAQVEAQRSRIQEQAVYNVARTLSSSVASLFGDPLKNAKVVNGVTVIYSKKDKKIMREMEEERIEKQRKQRLTVLKNSRLKFFGLFPNGNLPSISKHNSDQTLIYFAYSYKEDELTYSGSTVKISNTFSIGKFPDGTWVLGQEVKDKVSSSLASSNYTICGPFRDPADALKVRQSFTDNIKAVNLDTQDIQIPNLGSFAK